MKIKLLEIAIDTVDAYNSSKYPSNGIYLVKETDSTGVLLESIMYVDKIANTVFWVCTPSSIIIELEEGRSKESSSISEEFFLKSLSLIVNKDESYKN